MKNLKEKLYSVDKGRFIPILSTLDIKDNCWNCKYFNKEAEDHYLCAVTGYCIAVTLHSDLVRYLKANMDGGTR